MRSALFLLFVSLFFNAGVVFAGDLPVQPSPLPPLPPPTVEPADPTVSVRLRWHRLCTRTARDWAVHMPFRRDKELPLHALITPDPMLFVTGRRDGESIERAVSLAMTAPENVLIPLRSVVRDGHVVYPELMSREADFVVDASALMALQQRYGDRLAVYVRDLKGRVLGGSGVIPHSLRYDESHIPAFPAKKKTAVATGARSLSFLVRLGFQTRDGRQPLTAIDHQLKELCDQTVTPLAVRFGDSMPSFVPIAKGPRFALIPGQSTRTSWPRAAEGQLAWLALDRNGNGRIDDGSELFGEGTDLGVGIEAANGFAALAVLDLNNDGRIDVREGRDLMLWFDRNGDAQTTADELVPFSTRLKEISLRISSSSWSDANGNSAPLTSKALSKDGSTVDVFDFYLAGD